MKLIIQIKNDIVVGAHVVKNEVIKKAIDKYPYHPPVVSLEKFLEGHEKDTLDIHNTFAWALRKRDKAILEGNSADVIVLDKGVPRDYIGKMYVRDSKTFVNINNESDEERENRVGLKECLYPITRFAKSTFFYPNIEEWNNVMGEGEFEKYFNILTIHDSIIPEDMLIKLSINMNRFSEETKISTAFRIAMHISGPLAIRFKDEAIHWWTFLLGTKEESRGLCEIACIYAINREYDKASEIYIDLMDRDDLDESDKSEILDRIFYLGQGMGILERAKREFENSNYDTALKFVDDFENMATGRTKFYGAIEADNLRAKIYGTMGKETRDRSLTEKAKEFLKSKNERWGGEAIL